MKKLFLSSVLSSCVSLLFAQGATGLGRGSDYDVSGGDMTGSYIWALVFITFVILSVAFICVLKLSAHTKKEYNHLKKNIRLQNSIIALLLVVFFYSLAISAIALSLSSTTVCISFGASAIISLILLLFLRKL